MTADQNQDRSKPRTVRALIVPPLDLSRVPPLDLPRIRRIEPTLETIARFLGGGCIECVSLDSRSDRHCYIDDEGKLKALPPNAVATILIDHYRRGFAAADFIAGPAVFLGGRPDGEEADLPVDVIYTCGELLGVPLPMPPN